jgi:cell filamentation protein
MLENKLGITNEVELAREEERITKLKALELFDSNKINEFEVGTTKGLTDIHKYLFSDIYDFAGKVRDVNLPQDTFDNVVKKYIEMNVAHPFRDEDESLGQNKIAFSN